MNQQYPFVSKRAVHRCEYCHAPEAIFNFPFEVEHIIPISEAGADDETNLALACRACNIHKSNFLTGIDEVTRKEVRLFNPRRDAWEDHFRINAETGEIQGLSPVGRASALRLQMNSPTQLAARLRWMQLGLFP
jgi:hypothetical protein